MINVFLSERLFGLQHNLSSIYCVTQFFPLFSLSHLFMVSGITWRLDRQIKQSNCGFLYLNIAQLRKVSYLQYTQSSPALITIYAAYNTKRYFNIIISSYRKRNFNYHCLQQCKSLEKGWNLLLIHNKLIILLYVFF